jgi:hypothetical protein
MPDKLKPDADTLKAIAARWRKQHRAVELKPRPKRKPEPTLRAKRYRRAIALGRRLYREGMRTGIVAEQTGLGRRTVYEHTRDLYHQRKAELGRS